MTVTGGDLTLRPPTWARVFVAAFPFLFAGFFLFVVRPDGPLWLGAVIVFVFTPLLSWRLFRLAAIGTPDGRLVIRNQWRTRTLHRDDVADVTVDPTNGKGPGGWSVWLYLHSDEAVGLDVTQVPFRGPFRKRLERQAAGIREWVDGRPRPFL